MKSTKKILAESLKNLSAKKSFDKITIYDIVNRNKYDLAAWIYSTSAEKIMSKIDFEGYSWKDSLKDGINYFFANGTFLKNLMMNTSGQDSFINYVDALKDLCYKHTQISKILITHKHPDHTGALKHFPNTKIFISRIEADAMKLDGEDKFDANVKYRSCLQNFIIDTGKEIILVDTGTPEDFPEQIPDDKTQIYMGVKIIGGKNYGNGERFSEHL